ncbi:MAG TPA: sulfite exporter TauE/SafE family protein, partial [Candidatus Atribacteria bacterium]|nr:sulfite exporter TauE/SafE family protein [Candidatus Atribacteria bacterium]
AVIGCAVSIILKLIPIYFSSVKGLCDATATVTVLAVVSILSLYIFVKMIAGARQEIASKKAATL